MGELEAVIPELRELAGIENVNATANRIIVRGPTEPLLEISHGEQGYRIFEQRYTGGFQQQVYSTTAFCKDLLTKIELLSCVKSWLSEHRRLFREEEARNRSFTYIDGPQDASLLTHRSRL